MIFLYEKIVQATKSGDDNPDYDIQKLLHHILHGWDKLYTDMREHIQENVRRAATSASTPRPATAPPY